MKKYKRLQASEREEISRMLAQKCSFQSIAEALGRHVSTISREVGAGSCNQYTYRAEKAQKRATRNSRKRRGGKYALDGNVRLKRYVYRKLRLNMTKGVKWPSTNCLPRSPVSKYISPIPAVRENEEPTKTPMD